MIIREGPLIYSHDFTITGSGVYLSKASVGSSQGLTSWRVVFYGLKLKVAL